ncbi:hypothetical protein [Streptomyces griseosporeus]|uniref:hypothetical protein n=1 Tax=Streptomyces griseosporeus TaxID=1910 RepID=UPI0036F982E0
MLRITDDRTGEPVEAAPVRRGLTRVEAHAPGCDPGALRVLLVADLLVRALELGGTPVWALLNAERQRAELRAGAAALGIRPLEDSHDTTTGLGEAQIVHVAQDPGAAPDGVLLRVGPVVSSPWASTVPGDRGGAVGPGASVSAGQGEGLGPVPGGQGDPQGPGALPQGVDPAAVRLALLSVPRAAPVRLDDAALGAAGATLARWRRAVAGWARRPSRPIPDDVRARLRAAWEDDIDIPAVLGVLRGVEEAEPDDLPEGARFETYVYADRLLGLDLARDLGTPT